MRLYNLAPTRRYGTRYDPFGGLFSAPSAWDSGPRHVFEQAGPRHVFEQAGPRHNVEQLDEHSFRISVAVPGFSEDDLDVTQREDEILVTGAAPEDDGNVSYLHRGIGGRSFERRFTLAEGVRATGASLENGLLRIDLVREVPEERKPRTIAIAPPPKRKRKAA